MNGENPFHRASSLAELLAFHDLDFVRCAYVTILGRQPDLPGLTHNVHELRAGTSKLELLSRLRQSDEGRNHDPGIAGLDRALKRADLQRRPLLGAIFRFMRSNADGDTRNDRVLRAILNETALNGRQLREIGEQLKALQGHDGFSASSMTRPEMDDSSDMGGVPVALGQEHGETPELDHLRRRMTYRRRGPSAP